MFGDLAVVLKLCLTHRAQGCSGAVGREAVGQLCCSRVVRWHRYTTSSIFSAWCFFVSTTLHVFVFVSMPVFI